MVKHELDRNLLWIAGIFAVTILIMLPLSSFDAWGENRGRLGLAHKEKAAIGCNTEPHFPARGPVLRDNVEITIHCKERSENGEEKCVHQYLNRGKFSCTLAHDEKTVIGCELPIYHDFIWAKQTELKLGDWITFWCR